MASSDDRPSAQEVIQFVAGEVHVADLGGQPDIDYEALGRIDQMPEQEAVRLLDETMTAILFS